MVLDVKALLEPIAGVNPAGEPLRYTPVYDEIQEARREDDLLDFGEWEREPKKADWDKVIRVAAHALETQSKDIQIAVWLTEALLKRSGFDGLADGLELLAELLGHFWENLYPEIEDDDLEFRAAPLEFLNEKLPIAVRQIPLTDPRATPGYSLLHYQDSRLVGYESDIYDKYGSVDEAKRARREELIADGKITAEEFDGAVVSTPPEYHLDLLGHVKRAQHNLERLDEIVDAKFGRDAPRLAELRAVLEECERFVTKVLRQKDVAEPTPEQAPEPDEAASEQIPPDAGDAAPQEPTPRAVSTAMTAAVSRETPFPAEQEGLTEQALWDQALQRLQTEGLTPPLTQLLDAASRAPSLRDRTRLELLMAKLCIKADRPDLALPIAEKLNTLIEELGLERWESPKWIAEVLEALYQCLIKGDVDDPGRAQGIFEKICTLDVTKAVPYRSQG